MLIQFLLSIVLTWAAVLTIRRANQQAIHVGEAMLWVCLWVGIGIVIWRPELTTRIAHVVGVGRGVDLIVYGSIIGILVMVFQLHVAHERLERQLTELVRLQAMREEDGHQAV